MTNKLDNSNTPEDLVMPRSDPPVVHNAEIQKGLQLREDQQPAEPESHADPRIELSDEDVS